MPDPIRNVLATIDPERLGAVQRAFSGELILPGDERYKEARRVWSGMIDRRPALIARCGSPADVALALQLAQSCEMPLAVRGGGHSSAGFGTCDDGIVIDLSLLKQIELDTAQRTVRAGAGLLSKELLGATLEAGFAVPSGTISTVGISGLTLGGGFGWLSRKYGLTIDSLLAVEIVTPDGAIRRASRDEHPDLFWGLRGGGGNFGVATSFEFTLHPVTMVYAGLLAFPASQTRDFLRFYRDFAASAPDELTTLVLRMTLPPAPFVPEPLYHQPTIAVGICYSGDLADGAAAIAPLVGFAEPLLNMVGPMPYRVLAGMLNDAAPAGMLEDLRAGYLTALTDELIDVLVAGTEELPPMPTHVQIQQLGGAISTVGASETAYSHRDKLFQVAIISGGFEPAEAERSIAWMHRLWTELEPHTEGVYVNFLSDESPERVRAAYSAETYERLIALKRRYDPANLLTLNQNIVP